MADLARLHDRDEFSEWFKKKMPVIDCDPELILIAKTWAREAWDARQSEVDKLKHEMHMAVECGRKFEKERDALQARIEKLRGAVKFYANKDSWDERWVDAANDDDSGDIADIVKNDDVEFFDDDSILPCGGKRARAAIAEDDAAKDGES